MLSLASSMSRWSPPTEAGCKEVRLDVNVVAGYGGSGTANQLDQGRFEDSLWLDDVSSDA